MQEAPHKTIASTRSASQDWLIGAAALAGLVGFLLWPAHDPGTSFDRALRHREHADTLDQRGVSRRSKAARTRMLWRAVAHYESALELHQQSPAADLEGRDESAGFQVSIHVRLAEIFRDHLEDPDRVVTEYRKAYELTEPGDVKSRTSRLNRLGVAQFDTGEVAAAEATWRQALTLARQHGVCKSEAAALGNLGQSARYRGDIEEALRHYDVSIEIYEDLDHRELGIAYQNRGRFYLYLRELDRAGADLERALDRFRAGGKPRRIAVALTALGQLAKRRGDPHEALAYLEEALPLRREAGSIRGLAVTLFSLGAVHRDLGDDAAAVDFYKQALVGFEETDARRMRADTLVALGRLAGEDVPSEPIMARYRDALRTYRELDDPNGRLEVQLGIAELKRRQGDLAATTEALERGLELLEEVRGSAADPGIRATFLAGRFELFDALIDALMERHLRAPGAGFDRQAYAIAESARVRSLLDMLTAVRHDVRADADAGIVADIADLERRIGLLERDRLDQLESGRRKHAGTLARQRDALLSELATARQEIRNASPRYAAITDPVLLGTSAVQRDLLDEDTVLLSYHLGRDRSVLWVLTASSFEAHPLPARAEIEALADDLNRALRDSNADVYAHESQALAAELSRVLLAPAVDAIDNHRRLAIAPAGSLYRVPFSVLTLPTGSAPLSTARPVIEDQEIVVVPSASALAAQRTLRGLRPPPARPSSGCLAAVFADPVYEASDPRLGRHARPSTSPPDLRRLPHTALEVEAIVRSAGGRRVLVAQGFDANLDRVRGSDVGECQYIHLAMHAEVDTERPERSKLALSRLDRSGTARSGDLTTPAIHDLELAAELVTLSACETGLGKAVRGEGLVGLTQGFFSAGAERVLVSLWPVADNGTSELMTHFYRHLFEDGLTAVASLRAAQRAMRAGDYSAPYFWAGFVLQGDWR